MGKFTSQASAYVSFALAFIWFVLIAPTCEWLYTENWLVGFRLNLWTVKTTHGLGSFLASMASKNLNRLFDKLMDESIYLGEAKHDFCAPAFDMVFRWCDVWTRVYWASMFALFLGACIVLFHVMGAICMLYYVNEHATHTGRSWTTVLLALAPIFAILNVMQYAFLTWDFGHYNEVYLQAQQHTQYGMGIILAGFFSLISGVPWFMHKVISKPDPNEKYGEKQNLTPVSGNATGGGYGTAGIMVPPSTGYSQPPPPGYGQYSQPTHQVYVGGPNPPTTIHITQSAW